MKKGVACNKETRSAQKPERLTHTRRSFEDIIKEIAPFLELIQRGRLGGYSTAGKWTEAGHTASSP
ncbi:hypothetical protein GH141_05940 [bacterium]|nr:hypothetical protein [bacterium]